MTVDRRSVILVGTVSNVEKRIVSELASVMQALSEFDLIKIILIESDSEDSTRSILKELQESIQNLVVISLGNLKMEIPNRIERIRVCRQRYVLEVRDLMAETKVDLIAVADLDGMNSKLNSFAISSCFSRTDWDVVAANQKYGYYDLLALRHPTWCPSDVMELLRERQDELRLDLVESKRFVNRFSIRMRFDSIRKDVIYSKMCRIPISAPWVEVESAFGGFAFYKSWVFQVCDYLPVVNQSEHVMFHSQIREHSGRIFINPALINNNINTYNINRFLLVRQFRDLVWNSRFYHFLKSL